MEEVEPDEEQRSQGDDLVLELDDQSNDYLEDEIFGGPGLASFEDSSKVSQPPQDEVRFDNDSEEPPMVEEIEGSEESAEYDLV